MRRIHGVVKPNRRNIPNKIVNVQSARQKVNNKLRLDLLKKKERPVICIKRRLGGIGDVLMTTPLLKAIKELIPQCHLIYATDLLYAEGALGDIIRHNPFVDQLISATEIGDYQFDYECDVTTTGLDREKAGQIPPNRIDMFADEVGVSIDSDPVPVYIVTPAERAQATKRIKKEFLDGAKREDITIIAIQTRSNDTRRTWPASEVDELSKLLADDDDTRVLLFDWGHSVGKWEDSERIYPVLNEKMIETSALIEQVDLVICPDSSMLHLAGALGKKIVSIFGPIPPKSRINHYSNATAVILPYPCHPCWYFPRCTTKNNSLECLRNIKAQKVYEEVMRKLAAPFVTAPEIKYGRSMTKMGNQDPIILVKRSTGGIGDLVMATTGIEALKKKYPTKHIHVAVLPSLKDVLLNNPHVDQVLNIKEPINQKRYEMIIDISSPCARYEIARLQANKRVEKNRVEVFAEALGTRELIPNLKPTFHVSEEELESGKKFLEENGQDPKKKTIAIATHSAEIYRDWPLNSYNELIKLIKNKYNLVIIHTEQEDKHEGVIEACGLPFRDAIGVLASCDGLLTSDTGLLHIGAAIDLPTIAMFGPIDYRTRCKGYKNVTVIISDLPCIPCWRNGDTKCKQTNIVKCYSKCMENIPVKRVVNIINKKFKGNTNA